MPKWSIKIVMAVFIVGIVIVSVAAGVVGNLVFGNSSVDVTKEKVYSLSQQSKKFLDKNNDFLFIKLYAAENLTQKDPRWKKYLAQVIKLAETYEKESNGKIKFAFVKVKPFANTQAEAEKVGIKEFSYPSGEKYAYFGMVLANEKGKFITIPRFRFEDFAYIENLITRNLSCLTTKESKNVGIISPAFNVAAKQTYFGISEEWPFVTALRKNGYNPIALDDVSRGINPNYDAVVVFYPMSLDNLTIYSIDQYLMRGGNVIMFLDAFSENRFADADQYTNYVSGMDEFLENYGIKYSADLLVGDNEYNRNLVLDGEKINYPLRLVVTKENFSKHKINENINSLQLNHSGFLKYQNMPNLTTNVLFTTSENSGIMPVDKMRYLDYDVFVENYQATKQKYPLAVLVEGKFKSMFNAPIFNNPELIAKSLPFLIMPLKEGKLLIVADSDMMGENLWNANYAKNHDTNGELFTSDNLQFLLNALDYMTGADYVSVPLRKRMIKQMTWLVFLQEMAAQKYAQEKNDEQKKLIDAQKKLAELASQMKITELSSVKKIKETEQLQRELDRHKNNLEKINYDIEKEYNKLFASFVCLLIVVLPVAVTLLLALLYGVYSKNIVKKAMMRDDNE